MTDTSLDDFEGLYDEIELAILCDWLGRERPARFAGIDLKASIETETTTVGPVRLMQDDEGMDDETVLSNAVARIALNTISDRLPQWMSATASGELIVGRKQQPRRGRAVEPLPRFLLMINWADSGPGYSWPESYHATWLPGFECFVVTLSADSTDVYGYTDLALGHFPSSADFDTEVERIICQFWTDHTDADPGRAWQELWREGLIDTCMAYEWREKVWGVDAHDNPIDDGSEGDED